MWLAASAGFLCAVPSLAAEPLAPLLACRALADATARLACFDRESARLGAISPAPPGAPAAPPQATVAAPASAPAAPPLAAVATPAPPAPPDAKENFGLPYVAVAKKEVAAGVRAPDVTKIDAHITRVSLAGVGQATFTLDNGQVWRQLLSEGDLLAKPGDLVTVSRGVFNSYWLQLKSGRGCKVTRIL
jgi:hypothetical protein